jgi:hypothetical protein
LAIVAAAEDSVRSPRIISLACQPTLSALIWEFRMRVVIHPCAPLAPSRRLLAASVRNTIENLEPRLCLSAISLLPAVQYDTGYGTTSGEFAVADFNNDHKPDLALPVGPPSASVLLNQGGGTFGNPILFPPTHGYPAAMAAADFNHDGAMDLAVSFSVLGNSNEIDILFGQANGTFNYATPERYPRAVKGTSLAAGDFNGDGIADLAITNAGITSVGILLNNGDGSFATGGTFAVGVQNPTSVIVGDFDGDRINDLAVAGYNTVGQDLVSVLYGDSSVDPLDDQHYIANGNFFAPSDYVVGFYPVLAPGYYDFNGDGLQDLATVNAGPGNYSVLLGSTGGGFDAAVSSVIGSDPRAVGVGDFNSDGHADLAAVCGSNIVIRLGDGHGGFDLPVTYPIGANSSGSLAVADFNGDGRSDIAVTDSSGVGILLSDKTAAKAALAAPLAAVAVPGGTFYDFVVTYTDNLAVDSSTLAGAVRVTGPKGYSQVAALGLGSVFPPGDGTPLSATYRITPPGGTWDVADNGIYTVTLIGSKVAGTSGNLAAGRTLGTFTVKIGTASIAGTVFNDANSNGLRASTEKGLAGVTVYLDANKDGKQEMSERATTSDAAGAFHFNALLAGTYRVRQVAPPGFRATAPAAGYYDIILAGGQAVSGKTFGDTQRVLIGGTVFNDVNGDGKRATTEAGLSGWIVDLYLNGTGAPTAITTDASGKWSVSTLAAGKYLVKIVPKAGFKLTTPKIGSFNLALAAGQSNTTLLFGERKI